MTPLFPSTSESFALACRLTGTERVGWIGLVSMADQTVCTMPAVLTRSRTQGGIFTTPGDAYTTPVDMWVKALGEHFSSAEPNSTR